MRFLVGFSDFFIIFFNKNSGGHFWLGPTASILKISMDV